MSTIINNSIIDNTLDASNDFTLDSTIAEIVCTKGKVILQTKINDKYYDVSDLLSNNGRPVIVNEGTIVKFSSIETGRIYRLRTLNQISSAAVYNINNSSTNPITPIVLVNVLIDDDEIILIDDDGLALDLGL